MRGVGHDSCAQGRLQPLCPNIGPLFALVIVDMSQLDYGVIGNCQTSALVDKTGAIVWSCMPRFDAPAIFASLLDTDDAGFWRIEPAPSHGSDGQTWETRQHYMRNT